jgi:hypothetical protein
MPNNGSGNAARGIVNFFDADNFCNADNSARAIESSRAEHFSHANIACIYDSGTTMRANCRAAEIATGRSRI